MTIPLDDERFRRLLSSYPAGAIRILFDVYYRDLYRVACRWVRDHEAARDIVQETVLLVWKNRKQLGSIHAKPIHHYLVKVVRNKSITWYKDQSRLKRLDDLQPSLEPSVDEESLILKSDIIKQIRKVILTFPNKERECLTMRIDQHMSVRQMANIMNVSEKAIERSLTSAYKRLRIWAAVHCY